MVRTPLAFPGAYARKGQDFAGFRRSNYGHKRRRNHLKVHLLGQCGRQSARQCVPQGWVGGDL
jgi:hypothetical protein